MISEDAWYCYVFCKTRFFDRRQPITNRGSFNFGRPFLIALLKNKWGYFFEPEARISIKLSLRRTLVLFVFLSTVDCRRFSRTHKWVTQQAMPQVQKPVAKKDITQPNLNSAVIFWHSAFFCNNPANNLYNVWKGIYICVIKKQNTMNALYKTSL